MKKAIAEIYEPQDMARKLYSKNLSVEITLGELIFLLKSHGQKVVECDEDIDDGLCYTGFPSKMAEEKFNLGKSDSLFHVYRNFSIECLYISARNRHNKVLRVYKYPTLTFKRENSDSAKNGQYEITMKIKYDNDLYAYYKWKMKEYFSALASRLLKRK